MSNDKLVKVGLVQAIGFLLYIVGVFAATLYEMENNLIYLVTGLLMIGLIVVSGVYLVFYCVGLKNGKI